MSSLAPGNACRGGERPGGGAAQSYLAVCGTDRDSDIGSQHDCECRSQFNSESTVEEGGEGGWGQRDIFHCNVWDVLLMARAHCTPASTLTTAQHSTAL